MKVDQVVKAPAKPIAIKSWVCSVLLKVTPNKKEPSTLTRKIP
jgi:hypothetical protein